MAKELSEFGSNSALDRRHVLLGSALLLALAACPFRKLYPAVLVVQSSQDGNGGNGARSLDRSM